jgi:periplasmic divalent cation tolerance protein
MTDARIVLTTVALHESAMTIARTLVQERLAACVNVATAVESIYWWQGKLEQSLEYVLMIKTTASKVDALRARLMALHSYDLPEFVVLSVDGGSEAYLAWIRESVAG